MKINFVDLKRQYERIKPEIADAITDVLDNTSFILGEKVETLVDEKQVKGTYLVKWQPAKMGSGIYFGILRADNNEKTIRILYIK